MKLKKIFYLLIIFNYYSYSQKTNYEIPKTNFQDQKILTKIALTIGFSIAYKQAYWVAYNLKDVDLTRKEKRTNKFYLDPLLSNHQASNNDYKKSGYDKGHLAPAADMSRSIEVMKESFYFSNISPQNPQFNRGVWKKLEEMVRVWAKKYKSIYIVTGPILDTFENYIGKSKIAVPKYFYKTVLFYNNESDSKAIAFIIENKKQQNYLSNFVVSVDSLEKRTNIDFFYNLPDNIEKKIEKKSNYLEW